MERGKVGRGKVGPGRIATALGVVAGVGMLAGGVAVAATPIATPVGDYVQSVCTAKDTLHSALVASQAGIQSASQAFQAAPSQASAVALKRAFVDFLQSTAETESTYVAAVKAAGAPDVPRGSTFAKAYLGVEQSSLAKLRKLVTEAKGISTKTPKGFETDVKAIQRHIEAQAASIRRVARGTAVLKRPPTELASIAALVTADTATCAATP